MNEKEIIQFPDNVALISAKKKFCEDLGIYYLETKWEFCGHEIDINIDEYGCHCRIDGGRCVPNLTKEQARAYVQEFLEETYDLRIQV